MNTYTFFQGKISEGIKLTVLDLSYHQRAVCLGGKLEVNLRERGGEEEGWSFGEAVVRNMEDEQLLCDVELSGSTRLKDFCPKALERFAGNKDFLAFRELRGLLLPGGVGQPGRLVRVITTSAWSLASEKAHLLRALEEERDSASLHSRACYHPLCFARVGDSVSGDYLFVFRELDTLRFLNYAEPDFIYALRAPVRYGSFDFYRGKP